MLMPCQLINIFGHVPPFITRPGTLGWTNNNTHTEQKKKIRKNTHTYIEGRFIAARDLANRGIWSRLQPGQDGPGLSSALTPALLCKAGANPSRKCAHVAQCTMCNRCQQMPGEDINSPNWRTNPWNTA